MRYVLSVVYIISQEFSKFSSECFCEQTVNFVNSCKNLSGKEIIFDPFPNSFSFHWACVLWCTWIESLLTWWTNWWFDNFELWHGFPLCFKTDFLIDSYTLVPLDSLYSSAQNMFSGTMMSVYVKKLYDGSFNKTISFFLWVNLMQAGISRCWFSVLIDIILELHR